MREPQFAFAWTGEGGPAFEHDMPPFWRIPRSFWRRFGGGPRGPRMFGRGDMKYAVLRLLSDRSMHGYELIKAFEEQTGGVYAPSPGVIYPTLQMLEDQGWVTSATADGKKVYTITDEGRAALRDRAGEEEHHERERERHHHGHHRDHPPFGPFGPFGAREGPFGRDIPPELRALGLKSLEVAHLMRKAAFSTRGDPAKLKELQAIVEQTQASLQAFLQRNSAGQSQDPEPDETPFV